MADVLLSTSVRTNLLTLQNTAALMGSTQTRLASGKKVNSALDNPLNYFMASNFNTRASDLGALLDGMTTGLKTLEAVDTGLQSIQKLVDNAKAAANSAYASDVTTAKVSGTVANLTGASTFATTAGKTILIGDGTGVTGTFTTAGASTTVQQVLDLANNTANLKVKAILTGDGRIQLQATGANQIVIGGTIVAGELAGAGLVAGTTNAGTLNATRSALAVQFDQIRTQITSLATDASYNGQSLLNGDGISVKFNETSTSTLVINGVSSTAAGIGLLASTNTWQTDKDVNDALATIVTAAATLKVQAFGFSPNTASIQSRLDFTKSLINTLKTGADSLVMADTNEEGANLLSLQTRQQLAVTALSMATQNDQAVLSLFR